MFNLLIGSNLLMIAAFIFKFNSLPPQLPLFYTLPWGEEQLADTWMIFIIPSIMTLIYFVNGYIRKKIFIDNLLVKKIFEILNIFLIVSFTLIFIKVIFLIS
ncbi:MAG: hypothetical protein UR89_C0038G0002 [Candidatus Roizmanbacteria bacterium GW2011_GWA2_35_8]|uniref:DUF1648 domain-containing protein n=1 Tax=Candidatus Roizmanbacteria bacterium GW2011_GWA2_35_8 TaxID=1618479 RepID=A0A0G0G2I2_9BACT|nr:MAG: hypothetical protein UR89_C0038G0002 [Candidatus Roizmanbacteria bacterium GW2011_GWA2_35_8]